MGKSIFCLIRHKWGPYNNMGRSLAEVFAGNRLARSCRRCGKVERTDNG